MAIEVQCPRCNRILAFEPKDELIVVDKVTEIKNQRNAGHGMVVGSRITCPCGMIL